ncbi:MAG: UDP-N-acetylmuramate dehydrogenase [Lachnospiraceae bacterium]|nr:UDP-N-acetylmuramate dehydrogenase [Lachnospiraceae bacterium]
MQRLFDALSAALGSGQVWKDEIMKKHTTFRIGGPADIFVMPRTEEEICQVVRLCREQQVPLFIMGNGSNLLVADAGIRGVVMQLFKNYGEVTVEGTDLTARSGILLSALARKALACGLTGLEFASGIPGTLGGAAVMNAGAYGGEMKDVLREVRVLDQNGEVLTLGADELELGYRTSIIAKKKYLVLEAKLHLEPGDPEQIRQQMEELKEKRVSKQPLDLPSAGSTFKRPEGYFAGKLIMDAGLRGFSCGGAQVSEKHCGFVVNRGDATAEDVRQLIRQVQQIVREKYGVTLEPEIKMVGEFD